MIQLLPPLESLYMNQPFGVNWLGGDAYSWNPSGKHSGWDMRAPEGTPILAGYDGRIETGIDGAGGKYVNLFIPWGSGRELCVHHNHCSVTSDHGKKVKRGEQIGLTGNTGWSTGAHLHYGTRFYDNYQGNVRQVVGYNNGYRGFFDPTPLFNKDIWYRRGLEFKLPVDRKYGETKPGMTWLQWLEASKWIWKTYRRLMTDREMKALRWGYWDLQAVLDPGMFHIWSKMTKPAWLDKMGKL